MHTYTVKLKYLATGIEKVIKNVVAINFHSNGAIDIFEYGNATPFFPGREEEFHNDIIVEKDAKP